MRVGVDARVLMDKYYSGVSEYAANLLSAILAQDKNNKYLLFYNNRRPQEERLNPWSQENSLVRGTHYPNKIFNYLLQKIFSWPKIDRFLGGADILFAPHFNFLRVSAQTKLIIAVHDLSFLRYPEFFSVRKNFWHRALGVKNLLRRADHIIAVSKNTKEDLVEILGLSREKITVIHSGNNYNELAVKNLAARNNDDLGIEVKEVNSANNESRSEADANFLTSKSLRPGFILFLGNIEPRKNIAGLITAYESLRRAHPDLAKRQLVLAGGQGWKNRQIFSAWRKSPYQEDIKIIGYVSREEKEILYRQAGVFAYPSFYEGFGFPPLEAMSFGLPVVSTNVSSLPEVLGKAALLVDPFRSEELAETLAIALTNEAVRARLIADGLKRASDFSWDKTAEEYLSLFKKIHEERK